MKIQYKTSPESRRTAMENEVCVIPAFVEIYLCNSFRWISQLDYAAIYIMPKLLVNSPGAANRYRLKMSRFKRFRSSHICKSSYLCKLHN